MTESEILHNWLRAGLIKPDDYNDNHNLEPYKSLIVSMRRTKTWYTK